MVPAGKRGLVVASAALAFALAISGVTALNAQLAEDSDDSLPGIALPASPVTGTLDDTVASRDYDDVYAIRLAFNERLRVSMTSPDATDFDLQLWKPGSPGLDTAKPLSYVVQASSTEGTSTEQFWYPASTTGTHSIDVVNFSGKGAYRLTWDKVLLPTPDVTWTAPAQVLWGKSATITGRATLNGAPLVEPAVMIAARAKGTSTWSYLNKDRSVESSTYTMPLTRGDADGYFSYEVTPATHMEYRVIVWPTFDVGRVYGETKSVSPRAGLTKPSVPSAVYANRTFTVAGYLSPLHAIGERDVKIRFYSLEKDGSYRWRKTVLATNYQSTKYPQYTRYLRKTTVPFKGSWKIVASIAGDSEHAGRSSSARYLTVR